jgi:hypothetical protein
VGNDSLPLLLQQRDKPLLLVHKRIDLGCFAAKETGDRYLLGQGRK